MSVCMILTACGLLALAFYVREKIRRYSMKAVFLKSLVSVLFVAVGVFAARDSGAQASGGCIVLGLVLGLLGDIWLDLKYVFPQEKQALTYAGFASFALGHVLFIAGLLLRFFRPGALAWVLAPLALAVLLSALMLALEKPMKLRYGSMKPVVCVYGALLFATLLLSGSLALLYGWQERMLNLFFAGALLFTLSDLILSGTYFGQGRERPLDLALNYATYYPAQYLIALSLLFLK